MTIARISRLLALILSAAPLACSGGGAAVDCKTVTVPKYAEMTAAWGKCTVCHSSTLTGGSRAGAPTGIDFDKYDAAVMDADHIGVAQTGEEVDLAIEAGAFGSAGGGAVTQGLDRDPAPGGFLDREEDNALPATFELFQHLIAREGAGARGVGSETGTAARGEGTAGARTGTRPTGEVFELIPRRLDEGALSLGCSAVHSGSLHTYPQIREPNSE